MNSNELSNDTTMKVVLLHYGKKFSDLILNALQYASQRLGLSKVQEIKTDRYQVSKLIPVHVRESSELWLLIYHFNRQHELLIVPFPSNVSDLNGYAFNILEIVRGDKDKSWDIEDGSQNLKTYLSSEHKRSQLLRPPELVESFLASLKAQPKEAILKQVTKDIQQRRIEVLSEALDSGDRERIQELLVDFDDEIVGKSIEVFESIKVASIDETPVPSILKHISYKAIIDQETETFLLSVEAIEQFRKQSRIRDFDFTACGCGLWKAVERELNLSLLWYIRFCHGIVTDDPMLSVSKKRLDIKAGDYDINLNKLKIGNSGQLRGIEPGNIEYMLRSAPNNGIENY